MKKFKIDYSWYKAERGSGKVIVEALTPEEARDKFENGNYENEEEWEEKTLDYNDEITKIEEVNDEE